MKTQVLMLVLALCTTGMSEHFAVKRKKGVKAEFHTWELGRVEIIGGTIKFFPQGSGFIKILEGGRLKGVQLPREGTNVQHKQGVILVELLISLCFIPLDKFLFHYAQNILK